MRKISVFIPIFEGKILLQHRLSISKFGEEWGFFGGKIEAGETPKEAMIREAKEELELDAKKYKKLGKVENENILCHVFYGKLMYIQKLVLHEGDGMSLFSIDEARELIMSPDMDEKILDLIESVL